MENELTAIDIEIAVSDYFGVRKNIIVPNVWWGMGLNHECDLLVLTKSNYAYEIEIKTSKTDLIKDLDKSHKHFSTKIKGLYFAIPEKLIPFIEYVPKSAGILVVSKKYYGRYYVKKLREANKNGTYKFTAEERLKLAELGSMRIFDLKRTALYHAIQYKNIQKELTKLQIITSSPPASISNTTKGNADGGTGEEN